MVRILKEKIFRFNVGLWKVRVWMPLGEYSPSFQEKLEGMCEVFCKNNLTSDEVATTITNFCSHLINAVEVINSEGIGEVYYVDWP